MEISEIGLDNLEKIWIDESGRSVGIFCRKRPARVTTELIAELVRESDRRGGENVRFCLHDGPAARFHTMINVERKMKFYRPHKHLKKGDCFHIIKGRLAVFAFDDGGEIIDSCVLEPDRTIIYRIEENMYHTVYPITEIVIYHESKPGPFLGDADSIIPDWAPDESDSESVGRFAGKLLAALKLIEHGKLID
jgi:cupin fold WbuC family metalloprotein|tara:strand:- start:231 stop:809 length:579 start_codon:yes stop_codon:yes gene_type:complete